MPAKTAASKLLVKQNVQSTSNASNSDSPCEWLDPENFVDQDIGPEFMCNLCHTVFFNPVQVDCCLQVYCKSGILKWLQVYVPCFQTKDVDTTVMKTVYIIRKLISWMTC